MLCALLSPKYPEKPIAGKKKKKNNKPTRNIGCKLLSPAEGAYAPILWG